jgi:hypothetical protein
MRRVLFFTVALSGVRVLAIVAPVSAAETAASVVVSAQVSGRTSLKVSTDILSFDVAVSSEAATSAVDFSAGARTHAGTEVLLSVEQLCRLTGPGGARGDESPGRFTGQGDGTLDGVLATASPAVAGRWTGSGLRKGRLVFMMRAGASGRYMLPVHFSLSAP